jgi:hypothetical protein
MHIEEYWALLQTRICRRCVDGDGTGACRLPAGEECALHHYLPNIIATVRSATSESLDGYVALLRKNVCRVGDAQDASLVCHKRNDLECALDRYYPLVIEIVESIKESGSTHFAA